MPDNDLLPWQQAAWLQLSRHREQNRIPQALLISGSKGMGKYGLAKRFTYSLLCSNPSDEGWMCGKCRNCQLIESGTHPDFKQIKPEDEKKIVSVNQIRAVIADTYLKPQFEKYRVILINPADGMTISAANAFLKCLEEPTERTLFILITDKPYKLPATIASRCQKLAIAVPDKMIVIEWMNSTGINENQETLLNLLQGGILRPNQLAETETLKQRIDCFEDWMAIAKNKNHPSLVSEKWLGIPEPELLNWIISWVADLIKRCLCNSNKFLYNIDLTRYFNDIPNEIEIKRLFELYGFLLTTQQLLDTQVNFQTLTEEILVKWQQLNGRN